LHLVPASSVRVVQLQAFDRNHLVLESAFKHTRQSAFIDQEIQLHDPPILFSRFHFFLLEMAEKKNPFSVRPIFYKNACFVFQMTLSIFDWLAVRLAVEWSGVHV
jgi:hypothetical protein